MTTLVRWTPFREFDLMERRMRRMLEDVGFGPTAVPAADVYETPDEFVVELEVPGFVERDLGIEITDHTLIIKGAVTHAKEEEKRDFLLRERLEKTFERRFMLPNEADTKKLTAAFDNGVLAIHTPKTPRVGARKVAIGAAKK
jgi:HSP20 family protein